VQTGERKERQKWDTERHGISAQPPWFFYVPVWLYIAVISYSWRNTLFDSNTSGEGRVVSKRDALTTWPRRPLFNGICVEDLLVSVCVCACGVCLFVYVCACVCIYVFIIMCVCLCGACVCVCVCVCACMFVWRVCRVFGLGKCVWVWWCTCVCVCVCQCITANKMFINALS